jgi:tetratricopeptide (TPR) repeat protein
MSEMLANHYFLSRNYQSALCEYENVLHKNSDNLLVKKRLIICYIQNGLLSNALNLFIDLLRRDSNIFVKSNGYRDYCPCRDLIFEFENKQTSGIDNYEVNLSLGILWFYCNANNSIEYFIQAEKLNPNQKKLNHVIRIISDTILSIETNQKNNLKRS